MISWRGFSGNKGSPTEKNLYKDAEAAIKMTVVQSNIKKPIFEPILTNDESLSEDIDKLMDNTRATKAVL